MRTFLRILSIGALLALPGFAIPVLAQTAPPPFTPPQQRMMPQPRTPFDTAGRLASQVLDQEDTIIQLRQQMSAMASQESERAKKEDERAKKEAEKDRWWASWWKATYGDKPAAMQAPHPAPTPAAPAPSAAAAPQTTAPVPASTPRPSAPMTPRPAPPTPPASHTDGPAK